MLDTLRSLGIPQWLAIALLCTLGIALLWAGSTSTAAFGAYNPAWDGSREARLLASETADELVVIRSTSRYDRLEPDTATAIVLAPEQRYTRQEARRVRQFVRRGGTLVVAADTGDTATANALLQAVGAGTRIDGQLLRDERRYGASPAMPRATTVNDSVYTRNVSTLALNYASVVEPANGSNVSILVQSSGYGYLDANRDGDLDESEQLGRYPIVVVEPVAQGRVIVVSDPSVFINTMLDRGDNRAFVRNLYRPETVAVDYSHAGGVPPLVGVVLLLRDSALALLGVGILAVLGVALGIRGSGDRLRALRQRYRPAPSDSGDGPTLSAETAARIVSDRYPDWDDERVRRVAKRISGPQEGDGDD